MIPRSSARLFLVVSALAGGCATTPQPPSAVAEDPWATPCAPDGRSFSESLVYALSDEFRLRDVHGARVFRVPNTRLRESIAMLEQRPFVPLSPQQATHLLLGENEELDSRLASDAAKALAWAEERESEARDPFFKDHAESFRKEARLHRGIAAEAVRLRGGRTAPYLVRALVLNEGTGGFYVHFENGELSVAHASLGHRMVPTTRRPLVVYLESTPDSVCVDVSMAE